MPLIKCSFHFCFRCFHCFTVVPLYQWKIRMILCFRSRQSHIFNWIVRKSAILFLECFHLLKFRRFYCWSLLQHTPPLFPEVPIFQLGRPWDTPPPFYNCQRDCFLPNRVRRVKIRPGIKTAPREQMEENWIIFGFKIANTRGYHI